jgi:hypothetical protein
MLASIQFNNQLLPWGAKIYDVFTDGMLPTEMDVMQAV